MKPQLQKFLFFFFVSTFLLSAPILVLYTAGYRYHFGTGRIVKTGAISIKSIPRDADVFFNNERRADRTPTVLDNVPPGEHEVRIEKEGYGSWKKTLFVEENETAFIEGASLFLAPQFTSLISQPLHVSAHPNSRFILYLVDTPQWVEAWTLNQRTNASHLLARIPAEDGLEFTIDWSATGAGFILQGTVDGETVLLDIYPNSTEKGSAIPEPVESILRSWWDADEDDVFYVETNQGLFARNTTNPSSIPLTGTIQTAKVHNNIYRLIEEVEDEIVLTSGNSEQRAIESILPFGMYQFVGTPNNILQLVDPKTGKLLLLDPSDEEQSILLNVSAKHWEWDQNNLGKLLYSDGFDLNVYDSKKHTNETLTRLSTPILAIAWDPLAQVAYYTQNNAILTIEIDSQGGHIVNTIVETQQLETFWISEDGESLFFYGTLDEKTALYERPLRE